MRAVSLLGLGTALPPHRVTRARAEDRMARAFPDDPAAAGLARRVIARAGVEQRFSCVEEFARPGEHLLLGSRSPTTAARMAAYREHAAPLAERACRRALVSAGADAGSVTHLVVVTCTGFYAPGPDVDLVERLGMARDVERTMVAFMGCGAAFNGIRAGAHPVLAVPGARALVVCVELCSLHFRPDPSPGSVVAHALFGDGAAAVVLGESADGALARLGRSASLVDPDRRGAMGWDIGDDGFRMTLDASVPAALGSRAREFVARLDAGEVGSWCVHPGGSAILDEVGAALGLSREALRSSREVLRDVGNVSSATVLFVLERELARIREGARGLMLGFGPGLAMEGLAFERGARPSGPPERDRPGGP